MKTREFFFDLPEELIAQYPVEERGASRLLVVDRSRGDFIDSTLHELPSFLPPDSILVFNNSKVRKARIYGIDLNTGKEREFLFIRSEDKKRWEVLTPNARRLKEGRTFLFPESRVGTVECSASSPTLYLRFEEPLEEGYFDTYGSVPLPPYIHRPAEQFDEERYQTIYAQHAGSVAAPTAGLHFTQPILEALATKGIERVFVTLHVGLGTFEPIRTEHIENHKMHREEYEVSSEAAERINRARKEKKHIVAVGTTSVRVLESAYQEGEVKAGSGFTELYITPGYTFRMVDHLFTNFHTPGSTLLVLVTAFAGSSLIKKAYQHAIQQRYRFFSYGDAMLIL
ncbi:MAG: tRNA preQ1(34) S-adenosylmethionine ribosyltransferase-isomerase QueA [Spirochaetes bacterium]|nr:tRNA preQ1(34) S-adenosylmethionine ribosyltransferase-isomerase QueA [Spirochaetota bacterium]